MDTRSAGAGHHYAEGPGTGNTLGLGLGPVQSLDCRLAQAGLDAAGVGCVEAQDWLDAGS